MIKNIVLKQKQEKERLSSLPYVDRFKMATAKKWLDSDLIKVILGPRRAGKSVFSLMLLKDRSFAYFNFDDEAIPGQGAFDYDGLIRELAVAYGDFKYILFDEIQNLPKWEPFVNRLHREGYNLILTGSNARLLSKELATALTGRHIPIEIFPFDFKEFLHAKQYDVSPDKIMLPAEVGQLLNLLRQYLTSGGYPEVIVKNLDPGGYLDVLFDSLLFKDVIRRHRVRYPEQLNNLGLYLMSNISNQYSLRKLANILGFKSGVTLDKYITYLTEAYMIFSLCRYSPKAGERLKSPKKVYVVDNGFVNAKAIQYSPDMGKLLENMVFMELVKSGLKPNHNLFYYKTKHNREVDFIVKKGLVVDELIQVSYDVSSPEVERREVKALIDAGKELGVNKLTILTWNEKKEMRIDDVVISSVPVYERFMVWRNDVDNV